MANQKSILNPRHRDSALHIQLHMDGLDEEQRRAVHLLQEISNTTDDDVAVGVLSSVDWDIQVHLLLLTYNYFCLTTRFERTESY